ncbi:MAG TPA: Rrf2 family transcriptional regulator [Candidatus Omnitrophota bacterium]|nr:Rrf2 family transcriptional regulator [Candidatus Omnitrophota bacterium]
MKLITRNTDYAVRALCYLARQDQKSVPVSEMVTALKIPRPFLRKLLQTLSTEGILDSFKGQAGGFALAKTPSKIRLTDLIRIFQGTVELNECVFRKKICPNRSTCKLKREIDAIEKYVLKRLSGVTVASLLGQAEHGEVERG